MRNHDKVIIKDFDRISSPKKDADKNKMSIMALSSSVSVAQPARVNWQDPKELEAAAALAAEASDQKLNNKTIQNLN